MKLFVKKVFGNNCYQYLAAITGSLGILSSEMHFGWPSPSIPILTNGTYFFQVTTEEASWLAVTIFPGIVIGAILSSFLADILGRKKIILGTSVPFFFSWLIIALARNDLVMFVARFLGGIGGGLSFATVPMYLGEISEPRIRGLLSSLCPVFVVLGILLINVLGIYLSIDIAAYVACTVPLLMFSTFIWMPESPVLLMTQGNTEEAKKMLVILRGPENGQREFDRLSAASKETENYIGEETNGKVLDLFRVKENRKALLIALGLRTVQQFCGSTAITFYCKTIFQENEGFLSPNVSTILYFSLQAVIAVSSSFVVDILGRRPMFMFSLFGTSITLLGAGTYMLVKNHTQLDLSGYTSIPMVALLVNIVFFSMGVRNIPLLVMSEVFSPKVKPFALCFATIYYGLLAVLVTKFFHLTNQWVEMACPLFTFGGVSLVSLVLYYFFVPETKGKTLEEIQVMLKGEKK